MFSFKEGDRLPPCPAGLRAIQDGHSLVKLNFGRRDGRDVGEGPWEGSIMIRGFVDSSRGWMMRLAGVVEK
jgi:hypothetical protein